MINTALRAFGRARIVHPGVCARVIRAVRRLLRVPDREFVKSFFGLSYPGHTGVYLDSFVFYMGGYEIGALNLFADLAAGTPDFVSCDVGANVGHHTLFLSRLGQVLAFEPNPTLVAALEDKLRLNAIGHVQTFAVGLGSANAELEYFQPITANTGTGSFVAGFNAENAPRGATLKVVHGDEFMRANGISRIDLLKIDVEGFEREVLTGLQHTLDVMSPAIFLEVSRGLAREAGDLGGFLARFPEGYQAYVANVFGAWTAGSYNRL